MFNPVNEIRIFPGAVLSITSVDSFLASAKEVVLSCSHWHNHSQTTGQISIKPGGTIGTL